jgi:citrate lyase subunit beta / citryl-CoA lyase
LRDRITGSSVRLSRVWRKSDALIIDLEDSVPDAEKPRARGMCAEFVTENRGRLRLFVRVDAPATGLMLDDLAE